MFCDAMRTAVWLAKIELRATLMMPLRFDISGLPIDEQSSHVLRFRFRVAGAVNVGCLGGAVQAAHQLPTGRQCGPQDLTIHLDLAGKGERSGPQAVPG